MVQGAGRGMDRESKPPDDINNNYVDGHLVKIIS